MTYYSLFDKEAFILVGDALISTTVQYVLANLKMTSTFNIIHFAHTSKVLQHAADDLVSYVKISIACCIGLVLLYHAKFGIVAALVTLLINILVISSIYYTYDSAFKESVKENGLEYPKIVFF